MRRHSRMTLPGAAWLVAAAILAGCATAPAVAPRDVAALRAQVFATERAFAKTMADRDLEAFASFVADDAVFFTGPTPARGRAEVVARWKRFFEARQAPFSWEPADVEVLDSGTLALSSGPVFDPSGKRFATFTSVWRLEAPGTWRIVLDKGTDWCDCARR
jgi:ketosteroid isomerase-like protein